MRIRKKPMVFWLFAMRVEEREAVIKNIGDFSNAGVRFITIDFDDEENGFLINTYNLTETESKPYIDEIYRRISKYYNISELKTKV